MWPADLDETNEAARAQAEEVVDSTDLPEADAIGDAGDPVIDDHRRRPQAPGRRDRARPRGPLVVLPDGRGLGEQGGHPRVGRPRARRAVRRRATRTTSTPSSTEASTVIVVGGTFEVDPAQREAFLAERVAMMRRSRAEARLPRVHDGGRSGRAGSGGALRAVDRPGRARRPPGALRSDPPSPAPEVEATSTTIVIYTQRRAPPRPLSVLPGPNRSSSVRFCRRTMGCIRWRDSRRRTGGTAVDWKLRTDHHPGHGRRPGQGVLRRPGRVQRRLRPHASTRRSASCSSPRRARRARSPSARASPTPQPGSVRGMQVVIDDADQAREELVGRGVAASEVDDQPWGRFVYFTDPDGNAWSLQQLPPATESGSGVERGVGGAQDACAPGRRRRCPRPCGSSRRPSSSRRRRR